MKRRTFLRGAAGAAAITPVLLDRVYAMPSMPLSLLAQLDADTNDNILILVQLFGGNDGLNTVVPANDDTYYSLRPTIGIPKANLYSFGGIYMNPGLTLRDKDGFAGMFEAGTLAVLQNIGYPHPNLSHFRSTDIYLSGINDSDPNHSLTTGWVGRYLERRYPNFPNQLPADPLAINFGGFSLALTSEKGRMGIEVNNPSLQAGGLNSDQDTLDADAKGTNYELEYAFVSDIANRSNTYAQRVKDAYANGKAKLKGKYANDGFAQQMASVAALIAGGLGTRVYVVSLGGFDTHTNQADPIQPWTGSHANLLTSLSDAIAQFQYDLLQLDQSGQKVSNKVIGLTISEFGRRPHDNGSFGTDHGAASVQFMFGNRVNGVVIGDAPDLKNLDSNGDIQYQYDFRQIYTSILMDWFDLTREDAQTVLQTDNQGIDPIPGLIKNSSAVERSIARPLTVSLYPNPLRSQAKLSLNIPNDAFVEAELSSIDGKRAATFVSRNLPAGHYDLPVEVDLASGSYLLSLKAGAERRTQLVQVIR
jgi:uncharacterized protein (DUF1501 family)